MSEPTKLGDLLAAQADNTRELVFIQGGDERVSMTYAELWRASGGLAGALAARGLERGDYLILSTRSNLQFIKVFWAAVRIGVVPVPVAVGTTADHRHKLAGIRQQMPAARMFTDAPEPESEDFQWSDIADSESAAAPQDAAPLADDLAFIQYSSGSTGAPKGVLLSHDNLLTNIRAIVGGMGWTEDDRGLSWMPLTHDMGLIVMHLCFVERGMQHVIMDTDVFVRRPILWLEAATEHRSTVLCSPNFGYKHFLKVFERRGSDAIDLAAVETVFNGAEPISAEQCRRFMRTMAAHGLRDDAMLPVYGLAEATVGVSIPPHERRFSVASLDRHHLGIGDYCRELPADDPNAIALVRVGKPIADVDVRIADDDDEELARGHVGHLQLRGRSVTRGYLGETAEQQAAARTVDGWLRTGDCGAIHDGQLIITGRLKDLVIVNGQNYYAHDLEGFAHQVEGLELGKVAIAGALRPGDSHEQVVVFVLHRGGEEAFRELAEAVAASVLAGCGVRCDFFVPVARIPKTTSGKVQRALLARNFVNGEYDRRLVTLTDESDAADAGATSTLAQLSTIASRHSGGVSLGADDDLFDAGISSLTLTEIVLAFEEVYPGRVSIDELFDYPTLRKLAEHIDAQSE